MRSFPVRDIFANSAAVFVLTQAAARNAPAVEPARSLFGLTPAEARVARGLVGGKTADELAGETGVSFNTACAVLEKTGRDRQTDGVALRGGLSAVR